MTRAQSLPAGSAAGRLLSRIGLLALLAFLAACAGGGPPPGTGGALYGQPAAAPGPASDPWGPYIREASARFDVPEPWIRAVMKVESGGRTMLNGRPIVSRAGAMGLMQVMPATYEELRRRHGFGPDPFDPRDNVLAGTAYLREMYDRFGSPGFLAAYNAGPGRYGEYLAGNRGLPAETRNYVAMIAPAIDGIHPAGRAGVMVAAAPAPVPAPAVPAPAVPAPAVVVASVADVARRPSPVLPVQVASAAPVATAMPVSYRMAAPSAARVVAAPIHPARIQVAAAGGWGIQVGAFRSANDSHRAIEAAQRTVPDLLSPAERHVVGVDTPFGQVYRARLLGFSLDQAARACAVLSSRGTDCMTVSPEAQTS